MERFIGVDLGLRSRHKAVVFDGGRRRGRPFAVEVSQEGFERLLARATEDTQETVTFVIEPTGVAWMPLAAYVTNAGHRAVLAKTQKSSDLRKFFKKHTKSDVIDAETLARLPQLDQDGVHPVPLPTAEQHALRLLVKRRDRLMDEVAADKKRVQALLVAVNPPLIDALGKHKVSKAACAFLRNYADPEKVIKRGRRWLRSFWKKHGRGQPTCEARADQVYKACQQCVALYRSLRQAGRLPFDYEAMQQELRWLTDRIEATQREADELEKRIAQQYRELDPEQTLKQLQGVGDIIAAGIEAFVGDPLRFPNERKFVCYCGISPRKNQSGGNDPQLPIMKTGQRLLKKYLYLAVDVARQLDPDFASYYARRYAKGDHHNRILLALARKMAVRVYSLLKRREFAAQARAAGEEVEAVRYELRDANGQVLDKKRARALIQQKYTRAQVAPERHARDRARKVFVPPSDDAGRKSGRHKDATAGASGQASKSRLPIPESTGNTETPTASSVPAAPSSRSHSQRPARVGEVVSAVLGRMQKPGGEHRE
jgi:transposase